MFTEYYINNIDEKDIEIKNNIDLCLKHSVSGIIATYNQAKLIRRLYPDLNLGCFIDYPIASHNANKRSELISDAISLNIDYVGITIPFYWVVNRKYDKFREDIKQNVELCNNNKIILRYILEYRKFDHGLLCKICEILVMGGIDVIYPSTGFFLDNIEDNLIASSYLKEKTGINSIVNGNLWTQKQMDMIIKNKPYGFSTNSVCNFGLIHQQ